MPKKLFFDHVGLLMSLMDAKAFEYALTLLLWWNNFLWVIFCSISWML